MSVIGFQKKVWMGWVGGVSSIQVYFGFLEFFNFAKPLPLLYTYIICLGLSMQNYVLHCNEDIWCHVMIIIFYYGCLLSLPLFVFLIT